ncbi:MAG TPA: hypothetical protein VK666_29390 [Chryseolinea sp.]|nr:hypothetical protein [Chryseolinea sp.]
MPPIIRFLSIITICFSAEASFSQQLDNNPKLTAAESAWLNNHLNRGEFDFDGKYVAFSQLLTGGFYGIGKFMLRLPKKHVFHEKIGETFYQIYVLNEEEKRATNGYDAIIVFGDKKHKGKMKRLKRESVIADNFNRYPQIPPGAGEDNNPVLSAANAGFFNEIYRQDSTIAQGFNFSGKKIAIFSTQCRFDKIEQKTIAEYVNKVRASLDEWGYYPPEFTYVLNEAQKKESGDYDLIIQYRCKMDIPLEALIKKLKEKN